MILWKRHRRNIGRRDDHMVAHVVKGEYSACGEHSIVPRAGRIVESAAHICKTCLKRTT